MYYSAGAGSVDEVASELTSGAVDEAGASELVSGGVDEVGASELVSGAVDEAGVSELVSGGVDEAGASELVSGAVDEAGASEPCEDSPEAVSLEATSLEVPSEPEVSDEVRSLETSTPTSRLGSSE